MKSIVPSLRPIVTRGTAGKPVTNSRDVARYFGKPHNDVLKSIRALLSQAPACAGNFSQTSETVAMPRGGSRQEPAYLMDRDGFTLLAMGFTGPKALQFKMAYIAEFNAMEAELEAQVSKPQFVIPQTLPEARRLAAEQAWGEKNAVSMV
ncbi:MULTISPECIES: Rha family transcriptional regulator [unclassified Xanthobacter]|uniref:Rha family transcriptional regulator n=1 Tax=unclassified Xanthobacter TaxID=2623496 RepID=UPI001F3AD418|nr:MULTISPECIES: Rha family transcriptional regulator [unclassified Xanthobacter]